MLRINLFESCQNSFVKLAVRKGDGRKLVQFDFRLVLLAHPALQPVNFGFELFLADFGDLQFVAEIDGNFVDLLANLLLQILLYQ